MSKTPRTDEREFAAMELKPSSRVVYATLARELETELAEARAEIEKNSKLIERMKNCQNCGRTGGFCRHCRYAPDKRGWDDNWKEPI